MPSGSTVARMRLMPANPVALVAMAHHVADPQLRKRIC